MPAEERRPDDDHITQNAERYRRLPQEDHSQHGREDHLCIIKDGDILRRSELIRGCDPELSHGCGNACQTETEPLFPRHGMKCEDQLRCGHQTGEYGEAEHDHRGPLPFPAQSPYEDIRRPGTESAVGSEQCRPKGQIPSRTDDEKRSEKRDQHAGPVHLRRFLL